MKMESLTKVSTGVTMNEEIEINLELEGLQKDECFLCYKDYSEPVENHVHAFRSPKLEHFDIYNRYLNDNILHVALKTEIPNSNILFCDSCFISSDHLSRMHDDIENLQKLLNEFIKRFSEEILKSRQKRKHSSVLTNPTCCKNETNSQPSVIPRLQLVSCPHSKNETVCNTGEIIVNDEAVQMQTKKESLLEENMCPSIELDEFIHTNCYSSAEKSESNISNYIEVDSNDCKGIEKRPTTNDLLKKTPDLKTGKTIDNILRENHETSEMYASDCTKRKLRQRKHLDDNKHCLTSVCEEHIKEEIYEEIEDSNSPNEIRRMNVYTMEKRRKGITRKATLKTKLASGFEKRKTKSKTRHKVNIETDIFGNETHDTDPLYYAVTSEGPMIEGNNELQERNGKVHKCESCGRTFSTNSRMRCHQRSHIIGAHFQCDLCGRSYRANSYNAFHDHMRQHTGEKPFKCDKCEDCFRTRALLKSHSKIHITEFNFSCEQCGKIFKLLRQLRGHQKTHLEGNYMCEHCGKSYKRKDCLKVHRRTHSGEKYSCGECGSTFSQKYSLTLHIKRLHKHELIYQCDICGKNLSSSVRKQSHMRAHTGEKPYQCATCQTRFSNKDSFDAHLRTHTGEKFECHTCAKKFDRKQYLKWHMRTHTGKMSVLKNSVVT